MNKEINLIKVFEISKTEIGVYCRYQHRNIVLFLTNEEVTGEDLTQYEFSQEENCLSEYESLNEEINSAIKLGETEENKNIDLYLSLRDIKDEVNSNI